MFLFRSYLCHEIVLSQHLVLMLSLADKGNGALIALPDGRGNDVLVHLVVIFLPQSLTNECSLLLYEVILRSIGIGGCNDHSLQMLGVLCTFLHDVLGFGVAGASAFDLVWLTRGAQGRHSFEASD